jgi:hypothetical protein
MTDDPALALAQHVCRTAFADLPGRAVESARRDILDTFGCMLGGSGFSGIAELFAVIARWDNPGITVLQTQIRPSRPRRTASGSDQSPAQAHR